MPDKANISAEEVTEQLAENLHVWYLEACRELKPESFNPNAQKAYADLTEEQKFIDRFIAVKIRAAQNSELTTSKSNEERLTKELLELQQKYIDAFAAVFLRLPCRPSGGGADGR